VLRAQAAGLLAGLALAAARARGGSVGSDPVLGFRDARSLTDERQNRLPVDFTLGRRARAPARSRPLGAAPLALQWSRAAAYPSNGVFRHSQLPHLTDKSLVLPPETVA
jgi:hypothetical protein